MGTKLKELIESEEIEVEELSGKILVVDTFNQLYQFLSTIRQADGSLLKDSKGNVTSHLNGLFYRTTKLMQANIRLAFVFDGEHPDLKAKEISKRAEAKKEAKKLYEEAVKKEDIEAMKKYAARTSSLTQEMIDEAKELIDALGLPVIQAPSEGEAQAAFIVKQGDAYGEVSEDFDCLLFGVPKLVRNLSISGKKKRIGKVTFKTVKPELIELNTILKNLEINQDQLIVLGMLVGTDFNPNGIKGVGPKTASKLVKKYKTDFDALFKEVKWENYFDYSWKEVFNVIKKMPVEKKYKLEWKPVDKERIIKLLVKKHEFGEERVLNAIERAEESAKKGFQRGLGEFI